MCFSGTCSHELWSGECGKRRGDVCPEMFENDEELAAAEQAAKDYEDERGEYLYEQQRERRWQT